MNIKLGQLGFERGVVRIKQYLKFNGLIYTLSIIITVIFGLSCQERFIPNGFERRSIILQDSIFRINLAVPSELDTMYQWKDIDDNICADERKYRFTRSDFQNLKESGFVYGTFPDSSYQLTIWHIEKYECQDSLPSNWSYKDNLDNFRISFKKDLFYKRPLDYYKNLKIEVTKIDGLEFQIISYDIPKILNIDQQSSLLIATTRFKNIELHFDYLCTKNSCNDFYMLAEQSLKSIKIKDISR